MEYSAIGSINMKVYFAINAHCLHISLEPPATIIFREDIISFFHFVPLKRCGICIQVGCLC